MMYFMPYLFFKNLNIRIYKLIFSKFGTLMTDVLVVTRRPCSVMLPSLGMDSPQLA